MLNAHVTADWQGRPLETLTRLIEKRSQQLNERSHDSLFAVAQTFIRSLRPEAKVAKVSASKSGYDIEDTGMVIGKNRGRYVPHHRYSPDYQHDIRPICLWGGGIPQHTVHVWRIRPRFGSRMTWRQNMNKGCWYVAAYSQGVAENAAKRLIKNAIVKNRGLARTSINAMRIALAHLEKKADSPDGGLMSAVAGAAESSLLVGRQRFRSVSRLGVYDKLGEAQIVITHVGDRKNHGLILKNNLSYATQSLKNGAASISMALMKASNSIMGYLRSRAGGDLLDPTFATPFPEIARKRSAS